MFDDWLNLGGDVANWAPELPTDWTFGIDPNDLGFDWDSVVGDMENGWNWTPETGTDWSFGLDGGGGGLLGQVRQWLNGGGGGSGGGGGLGDLLRMIAGIGGTVYGGLNAQNATEEATRRLEEGAGRANQDARDIFFGAVQRYDPYSVAGYGALDKVTNMEPSDLASKFGPIGQPSALAGQFGAIGAPSNIASQFKPLGSGRSLRSLAGGR